ncbi:hypothetical protein D3C77_811220 [compost metagenome]
MSALSTTTARVVTELSSGSISFSTTTISSPAPNWSTFRNIALALAVPAPGFASAPGLLV